MIIVILFIIALIVIFYYGNSNANNTPISQQFVLVQNEPDVDPVTDYDVNNIHNPLVYPTLRPNSHIYNKLRNNPLFEHPTRGFPDKPTYIANLIEVERTEPYNPQLPSVLQLIAQQKYPNGSVYDYYVLLPTIGNGSPIKYTINTPHRNQELYDDDIVNVINKQYRVKRNKNVFEYR